MQRRQRAFTLVELLVVIAIIGVLIALLLPAVQKVREAGNRLVCQNNMKQIGVALHGYHDAAESFPMGNFYGQTSSSPNWRVYLFPYLEQGDLYRQLHFDTNGYTAFQCSGFSAAAYAGPWGGSGNPSNSVLTDLTVKVYTCPSSTLPTNPFFDTHNNTVQYPGDPSGYYTFTELNNAGHAQIPAYIGISGAAPDPIGRTAGTLFRNPDPGWGSPIMANSGMLVPNESIRIEQCLDGTSNTIIVGEQSGLVLDTAGRCPSGDCRQGDNGGWAGNNLSFGSPVGTPLTGPMASWSPACNQGATGYDCPSNYNVGDVTGVTVVATQNNGPGQPTVNGDYIFTNNNGGHNGPKANSVLNSFHTAGINVLLSDGSVRFVSDNVTLTTFQRACVRNDGLELGSDW